jgi:predicted transcriptional regulator
MRGPEYYRAKKKKKKQDNNNLLFWFELRDRIDIIADVLKFVSQRKKGAPVSRIRQNCSMPHYGRMMWYVCELIKSGLLDTHVVLRASNGRRGTRYFTITDKGREFLSVYEKATSLLF